MLIWVSTLLMTGALQVHAIEVLCHRGANEVAPENTLAAAKIAADWGADYVEIDVRTSSDGVMVLMHDANLKRTTDGQGMVHKTSAADLAELDAGGWFSDEFAAEPVPVLREFMEWARGKIKIYFDVKYADVGQLVALVREMKYEKDAIFYLSFSQKAAEFHALAPDLALKVNVKDVAQVREAKEKYGASIVEVRLHQMTPEVVAAARELDLKIMVYHPEKDPEGFAEIIRRGADMINLNHADLFYEVLNESKAN